MRETQGPKGSSEGLRGWKDPPVPPPSVSPSSSSVLLLTRSDAPVRSRQRSGAERAWSWSLRVQGPVKQEHLDLSSILFWKNVAFIPLSHWKSILKELNRQE